MLEVVQSSVTLVHTYLHSFMLLPQGCTRCVELDINSRLLPRLVLYYFCLSSSLNLCNLFLITNSVKWTGEILSK